MRKPPEVLEEATKSLSNCSIGREEVGATEGIRTEPCAKLSTKSLLILDAEEELATVLVGIGKSPSCTAEILDFPFLLAILQTGNVASWAFSEKADFPNA